MPNSIKEHMRRLADLTALLLARKLSLCLYVRWEPDGRILVGRLLELA